MKTREMREMRDMWLRLDWIPERSLNYTPPEGLNAQHRLVQQPPCFSLFLVALLMVSIGKLKNHK